MVETADDRSCSPGVGHSAGAGTLIVRLIPMLLMMPLHLVSTMTAAAPQPLAPKRYCLQLHCKPRTLIPSTPNHYTDNAPNPKNLKPDPSARDPYSTLQNELRMAISRPKTIIRYNKIQRKRSSLFTVLF